MRKIMKSLVVGLLLVPSFAAIISLATPTMSMAKMCSNGTIVDDSEDCPVVPGRPNCLFGEGCAFSSLINTLLFLLGAISVIMLIYGGIRYTISGGDANSITAAKNTILYAVIGLVVALLAFAIVNFVLDALK